MRISYGLTVLESDDPFVSNAKEALRGVTDASVPGAFLVDLLPILRYVPSWVPGAGFKRTASYYAKVNVDVVEKPFKLVKRKMVRTSSSTLSTDR